MSTYGIDLGTTYSCIARLDSNGNPEVIRNNEDDSNTVRRAGGERKYRDGRRTRRAIR